MITLRTSLRTLEEAQATFAAIQRALNGIQACAGLHYAGSTDTLATSGFTKLALTYNVTATSSGAEADAAGQRIVIHQPGTYQVIARLVGQVASGQEVALDVYRNGSGSAFRVRDIRTWSSGKDDSVQCIGFLSLDTGDVLEPYVWTENDATLTYYYVSFGAHRVGD